MTDQDPTQAFQPPAAPPPPGPDASAVPPPAPPAPAIAPEPAPVTPPVGGVPAAPAAPAAPDATIPAAPAAPAARKTGRSPVKWIAAAIVVLLVVALAVGATMFLTSSPGAPTVGAWTPADSVAYAELRLDLPGTQGAELAKVMKAFPGFQDQAAFPVKLSEVLDQLVGKASGGKESYKADIEPWFTGQIAASIGPVPATADPTKARELILLGTKDAAKAQAWAAKVVGDTGSTTSTETYNGVTVTLVTPGSAVADLAGMKGAYAVVGPALAIGDEASVKASIDTGGKTGLTSVAQFQEAESSVPGDRLGFGYLDLSALVKSASSLAGDAGASMQLPSGVTGMVPPWAAAAFRADNGAFVVDTRTPHVSSSGAPNNSESKLPGLVPATTAVLVEGQDVGQAIARTKDLLKSDPSLADGVKQVEDALALLGGFDAVTGWIDELGVVITSDGGQVNGGIVATPTDAAAADRLFTQITGFIQLGGGSAGLSVSTEDYKGTKITKLNVGGAGALLGGMAPGVQVPADATIAFAVTDSVVVFGYGDGFVKSVLDAKDGQSLADTDRFAAALKRVDAKHTSLAWIDIVRVRALAESMLPSASKSEYDTNLKPYLAGFDSLIATTAPGDKIDSGTVVISVTGG